MKDVIATGLEVPEGPVVLPDRWIAFAEQVRGQVSIYDGTAVRCLAVVASDGEVLDLVELDEAALPTNCCFDGSALWVTDIGRDYETLPGRGRLWRVETDAVGAAVAAGAT